jgi:hypothetical protein
MKPDRPSATAYRVAMRRAAQQILDRPVVLDDPIALRIVGPRGAAAGAVPEHDGAARR